MSTPETKNKKITPRCVEELFDMIEALYHAAETILLEDKSENDGAVSIRKHLARREFDRFANIEREFTRNLKWEKELHMHDTISSSSDTQYCRNLSPDWILDVLDDLVQFTALNGYAEAEQILRAARGKIADDLA
ncbi:hypothetical protein [Albidovulum aquaemixtae]|uniref:hypothetical protein n=1 Tax=Albidovulum aquaemixtae TaxID=1542388 RepID=UPI0011B25987|nr:hypothetical protein [Defluviimonas aquaemixtae]